MATCNVVIDLSHNNANIDVHYQPERVLSGGLCSFVLIMCRAVTCECIDNRPTSPGQRRYSPHFAAILSTCLS